MDGSPEMESRYRAMLFALPPEQRLAMASRMFEAARVLALAGRPRGVENSPAAIRRFLFLRFYGRDFSPSEREKIVASLMDAGSGAGSAGDVAV